MEHTHKYFVICPKCNWESEHYPCPEGIFGALGIWTQDLLAHVKGRHKIYYAYLTIRKRSIASSVICNCDRG